MGLAARLRGCGECSIACYRCAPITLNVVLVGYSSAIKRGKTDEWGRMGQREGKREGNKGLLHGKTQFF